MDGYKIFVLLTIRLNTPNAMLRGNNYRSRIFGRFPARKGTMNYQQMLQCPGSLGLYHTGDLKIQEHNYDFVCIDANSRRSQGRFS